MKFKGKWLPEKPSYREACLRLSKDLSNFKQDPEYAYFVGNDTRGKDVVEAFDKVVDYPYVHENDVMGSPILHNCRSAGTLRYMKVLQDIDKQVGLASTDASVIEIGGGYGGQCLVFNIMGIEDYTIIDLPEANELQRKYLEENDIECNLIPSTDVPECNTEILLSDYCLSEFDQEGVDFYLDLITFEYGYFTGMRSGIDRIANTLIGKGYTIDIDKEVPKTSKHENFILTAKK